MDKFEPECMRCDSPLTLIEEIEEIGQKTYLCENCGTIHVYYECPDEDKENHAFYNDDKEDSLGSSSHGYDGLCPNCGSHIIWSSDFMRSEVWGDVDNDDDDSLVSSVYCPHCGGSVDIIECKPSEYHKFPIYKNKEK